MKTELSENARKVKNNYQKQWSRNNPEKVKEHQAKYWERKAAELEEKEGVN